MKALKKATAVLLAAVMLLSMGVSGNTVQASEASETEPVALVLNQTTSVSNTEDSKYTWFSFTPEQDGAYVFKSLAPTTEIDPSATLYKDRNAGPGGSLAYDDDGGNNWNFLLGYSLTAGETYYLQVYARKAGTFGIIVEESEVKSVTIQPVSLVEESLGSYQNPGPGEEYYYYYSNNWSYKLEYSVTMKNDDVVTGSGSTVEYNGNRYLINITDNQNEEHWYPGNTYTAIASVGGCTTNVSVTIVESPIQSISIAPIKLVENEGGYLYNQGTEYEYYSYFWTNRLNMTLTMKDGQVITDVKNGGFDYKGEWYSLYITSTDDQSSQNPWLKGNTYTGHITLMGCEATVEVSIVDTLITSLEIEPVVLIKENDGDFNGEYFHYYWYNSLNYSVTFADGQTDSESNRYYLEYEGFDYYFHQGAKDNQSAENPWLPGNTYTATLTILGYTAEVQVSIVETPIKSMTVEPITMKLGQNISYMEDYVHYYWYSNLNYTIEFLDGTKVSGNNGNGFYYNGRYYGMSSESCYDTQSSETPWEEGNTYTGTIDILGYQAEVSVTIPVSPIDRIEFEPIALRENQDGWYWEPGTPEEWFEYSWQRYLKYTIVLKDGRSFYRTGTWGEFDGISYHVNTNDYQYEESWYVGNTYKPKVSLLGKTYEVPVSICEAGTEEGFEYMIQDDTAIIVGCDSEETNLTIPSTLGGYPVVAITDLTGAMNTAEEVTIPDSVTMLSSGLFDWNDVLVKVNLGAGISQMNNEVFIGATELQEVNVSANNPNFTSIDGVVYDKAVSKLVVFPRAKAGTYTVPSTVTDIECLIQNIRYYGVKIDLGNSNTNYVIENGVIYNKDKTVVYACDTTQTGKYVMPNSVTTINEGAFMNCSFSEVVVSENVSELVYASFAYSMQLEKVVLPNNLKTISGSVFAECENLVEADLPANLETLEEGAFQRTSVKKVTIPSTLKDVGYYAYNEAGVEELTISEGVEVIWGGAFNGTKVKNVILPNSLTHMSWNAFSNTPLETVTIGTGLDIISEEAFYGTKLKTVTLPENIAEVDYYAFANSTLEEVIFEREDIYIWEGAFQNCPLKEIDLKNGVVAIDWYAFYGTDIESVVIPDSVTEVTYKSFAESKNLLNITLPEDLEALDGTAFDGTAWWEAQPDGVVYLDNYLYGYKGTMPEDTEITVKEGTTLIADYAFSGEMNLKSLHLPKSLKNIGDVALYGCFGLETITVDPENEYFSTNETNTVLYDEQGYPIWKRISEILYMHTYADSWYYSYGISLDEWLEEWKEVLYLGAVRVQFADGSEEYLGYDSDKITVDMISGFDGTKPGWQTLTFKIGKFTVAVDTIIDDPYFEDFVLEKLPNKTVYDLNQDFRPAGLVFKGILEDGRAVELKDYTLSGYDPTQVGVQTITLAYEDFEAQFEVEVRDDNITYVDNTSQEEVKVEVSVPKEAIEAGATLIVEEKELTNIQDVEVPEIFEEDNSMIFDIRFEKEEEEVQPTQEVTVSIPVPAGIDGRNCKVYHLKNGATEDMNASYVDGFLVFTTTHFSYYGLVELPGVSISGTVTSANTAGDVTVKLFKGTEEYQTVQATNGEYIFTNVLEGTYTITVSKANHVTRTYEVTVGEDAVVQDVRVQLIGDVNGDNNVNYADIQRIYQHISTSNKVTGYALSVANVNGDNNVNYADIQRIYQHISTNNKLF